MGISRMELADAGSPEKLVTLILKFEPDLPIPVPIEDLARQLDIVEIHPLTTAGFVGGLVTDTERSSGLILVQDGQFEARRRFTVAHELGHFLIPTHVPDTPGRFLCSRADLQRLTSKEADRRARMEAEANRFASLLLIPPPYLRQEMRRMTEPDLQHIPALARRFNVSKEAMARAYAQYHEQPIAVVVTHNGKVLRSYRNVSTFPFIAVASGQAVPSKSLYHRAGHQQSIASGFEECMVDLWIDHERGTRAPTLFEQVYPQQDGYGLILLHLVRPDEDEDEEERDLNRRWAVGFR